MIEVVDIERALRGEWPHRSQPLSPAELGERLAIHRVSGPYSGLPFSPAYITNVLSGRQGLREDFEQAFELWRAAEVQRRHPSSLATTSTLRSPVAW